MNASSLLPSSVLTDLDLYNWGPFEGRHSASMDLAGTAIIGPTGSGKTTLIDALMTLLVASPRYNLASTGGHESDRDLVSYVRGVSGAGNDSSDTAHIGRPGAVVSAIAARFSDGAATVRIGAVFWFDGTSSALADLKRRWLFCLSDEPALDAWLEAHRDGNARGLKELERQVPGLKVYETKQPFLSRLRSHFEVGENAFSLLNRAAGLKQLNSIDEVFRELVLDDRSGFESARAVADEFTVLVGIRAELETARRQRDALLPVERSWKDYQAVQAENQAGQELQTLLPAWYAGRRRDLWSARLAELQQRHEVVQRQQQHAEQQIVQAREQETQLQALYIGSGGAQLEMLRQRIDAQQVLREQKRERAGHYGQLAAGLNLQVPTDDATWRHNQQALAELRHAQTQVSQQQRSEAWEAGARWQALDAERQKLGAELAQARRHTTSNVPVAQQMFRLELANHLQLAESELPFLAEQVQVPPQHAQWRGAIERALGSDRLRLIVPSARFAQALAWVNGRDNKLHVRLLDAHPPAQAPSFFGDGFARMLEYAPGPHSDAVKALVAGKDRHCVADTQALQRTAHAMTVQGSLSGSGGRFEKQDQKPLDRDWMTGFDNRDRVQQLEQSVRENAGETSRADALKRAAVEQAEDTERGLRLIDQLQAMRLEDIDHGRIEQDLQRLTAQLQELTAPGSKIEHARLALQAAQAHTRVTLDERAALTASCARLEEDIAAAGQQLEAARASVEAPLDSQQHQRAAARFTDPPTTDPHALDAQERAASQRLADEVKRSSARLNTVTQALLRELAAAKAQDTGALSEAGISVEDVPAYRARLTTLVEEALPERLSRFLDYLNQSSDQGVTQLLSQVDIEVAQIEERIHALNTTLCRVDFQQDRYLQLEPQRVEHESLRTLQKARQYLRSAQLKDDEGETHYQALAQVVALLRDATERRKTQGALALLDPRYRLRFAVLVCERGSGRIIEKRTSSQGGSGGEKEIIASYVLTASLSYALCPFGRERPLFGTVVLDEAFSKSSHAVAGRIVRALHEFGLHPLFVTPNKELRLLRDHTRSAIVVHRRGRYATLTSLSWQALEDYAQARRAPDRRSG
ncbi:ATP-binding protein [Stenotrophomonas sp. NPDC077659]|uniref:ATP-binding protein n=1 Tax=Stenotrophomonas sp. NPDC077659 TaxID=3390694 RepID=UPI003CFE8747